MSPFAKAVIVFVGGGIGTNLRYWLGGWVQDRLGPTFPYGTFIINATGSLLIGLFLGIEMRSSWDPSWRLLVAVGLMGGYTTFSTFSYETVNLLMEREYALAFANALGQVAVGLAFAWLGLAIAKAILGA